MTPWIKAGFILAGIIILLSTTFIGAQLEQSANESLGLTPFYIVSILSGCALIAIGTRIKGKKSSKSENSAK
ncbi:hypothetical protein KUV80_14070 [Fictibacillus nanhaiensis]|uniref:hypothetical protein n=1 Tax=Fictibacillus nanhaiensis TaxID=742169 RepID=UPI001C97DFEB|nr:hypothetical protein [Fictibacillus nanhaiensis]MBY6037794.1 hypothetical protein [Fictibacillus nanhaiensis]